MTFVHWLLAFHFSCQLPNKPRQCHNRSNLACISQLRLLNVKRIDCNGGRRFCLCVGLPVWLFSGLTRPWLTIDCARCVANLPPQNAPGWSYDFRRISDCRTRVPPSFAKSICQSICHGRRQIRGSIAWSVQPTCVVRHLLCAPPGEWGLQSSVCWRCTVAICTAAIRWPSYIVHNEFRQRLPHTASRVQLFGCKWTFALWPGVSQGILFIGISA